MKKAVFFCLALAVVFLAACGNAPLPENRPDASGGASASAGAQAPAGGDSSGAGQSLEAEGAVMMDITVQVGEQTFAAKLFDTPAARAAAALMPLTLEMQDLNGNEKYGSLPEGLPSAPARVGDIRPGDIMLFGSDCLVLFYEGFSSPYSYTPLGYVEDASGLAAALEGSGVQVSFAAAAAGG